MESAISFILSVMASVVVYNICKWLGSRDGKNKWRRGQLVKSHPPFKGL